MSKTYTIDDVKSHWNERSAWIIIHNDVYDVTPFLQEHPGGADSLLDVAGKDGTEAFEDVSHSEDARIMMKKYKIGSLSPGQCTKFIQKCCKSKSKKKIRSQNECADCTAFSCPILPKSEYADKSKSWRTYDGSSGSTSAPLKSDYKSPASPRPERRVQSIIVPKERRPRGPPCGSSWGSARLKWALIALAGALVLGFVIKKYAS